MQIMSFYFEYSEFSNIVLFQSKMINNTNHDKGYSHHISLMARVKHNLCTIGLKTS